MKEMNKVNNEEFLEEAKLLLVNGQELLKKMEREERGRKQKE